MLSEEFRGFGQFSRPDIGLISDGFQNLSEIFESDRRDALRNILVEPESLDQIYGLSGTISREDLRAASGLSSLLLPTLHRINNISDDVILDSLESQKIYFTPKYPLGGYFSNTLNSPNIVLFNGSIKCYGAFYRANVISNSLFSNPEKKLVALSTSRSSLFSADLDEENVGFFKNASYPGTIRVRRRSHVNRVFVPEANFVEKPDTPELPSHTIKFNITNGTTGQVTPLRLLATKNSPLKIFCRLSRGTIKFKFSDSLSPYFYGYQIQPVQQRPNSEPVNFLDTAPVIQETGSKEFTLSLDITRTGYQTVYDLNLYLYLNPEKVIGLEFNGVDIRESPDRKDMGLVGFNNLEELRISGGSITILPIWLKTLSEKLRILDLRNTGDTWKSGPMGWFDIRDPGAIPSFNHPLYTAVSYLTIPKSGPMINEAGDDWSDDLFRKYVLGEARLAGTDFRQFTKLSELYLGDRFRGLNPNFNDVFPNLRKIEWKSPSAGGLPFLSGTKLPSIKNTGSLAEYDISGSGASGTIYDIGTSSNPEESGYVSKYSMVYFNISGFIQRRHNITGFIGNPGENWDAWYQNCVYINLSDTSTKIDIQSNTWKSLKQLYATRVTGLDSGINFSTPSSPLKTPFLRELFIDGSKINGQMPSLGDSSTLNSGELFNLNMYGSTNITPVVKNGINYFLPENFAPARSSGTPHKLFRFVVSFIQQELRFRERDLVNLRELAQLPAFNTGFTGRFPIIPSRANPERDKKIISIDIRFSNFYDLRNLSISPADVFFSRDAAYLDISNQNVSGGGSILPSFEGAEGSENQVVIMDNSLPTRYPASWSNTALRSSCVSGTDQYTEISGLVINRTIQTPGDSWTERDNIYTLTGAINLTSQVLVNDSVRSSVNGPEIARVLSVKNTEIVVDRDIPGTLPTTLYFYRNTVDISNWFSSGFFRTLTFRARNCRLSGSLRILPVLATITFLDLSENVISGYTLGSLSRIFVGNSRAITVNLSYNNLSVEAIRSIISDAFQIDSLRRFRNCFIRAGFNKLDSTGKYTNFSQAEIFPTQIRKGNDIVTSLFREEQFYVYETVTSFDENGDPFETKNIVGTRNVSVSGALVGGSYYKTRINETQVTVESQLAISFKNLSGVRVDLGFNYISPSTTPIVTSTQYSDETTRIQSIIDAGLNPEDLVNP